MKVELKTERSTTNPDETAIMAARGDYMTDSLVDTSFEEAMEGTSSDKEEFVERLLRRGHFGPFEHSQAYFAVEGISRVVLAQVTRHRHMSFDVQSMRYVDFEEAGAHTPESFRDAGIESVMDDHMQDSLDRYDYAYEELKEQFIEDGIPEEQAGKQAQQDARYLLPLGTKVNMTFSANSRALMHVFDLRDNTKAQPETQAFASEVREAAKEWAPVTFEGYEEYINNNSLRAP